MLYPISECAQGAFCRPLVFLWLGAGDGLRQTSSAVLQTPSSLVAICSQQRGQTGRHFSSKLRTCSSGCSTLLQSSPNQSLGAPHAFLPLGTLSRKQPWHQDNRHHLEVPRPPWLYRGCHGETNRATLRVSHLLRSTKRVLRGGRPRPLVSSLAGLQAYNPFWKQGNVAQHKAGRNEQMVEVV